jgi:peptidoglycan hydrolase-like protein with peptidoglycan-binding domain
MKGSAVDGLFGSGTASAVKTWQKKNGITADGVVGLKSWKKILGVK